MDLQIQVAVFIHTLLSPQSLRPCRLQRTLETEIRVWKGSKRLNHELRHLTHLKRRSAYESVSFVPKAITVAICFESIRRHSRLTMTRLRHYISYGGPLHGLCTLLHAIMNFSYAYRSNFLFASTTKRKFSESVHSSVLVFSFLSAILLCLIGIAYQRFLQTLRREKQIT